MEGAPFGKYQLITLLGRGGMGEVWRAFDTATDRVVALKVLPAHLADDEMFQKRFRREARAAAGLSEPHIIPIHSYGEIDGRLYVDMRLVVGQELQAVLRAGPLAPARAVMVIEQVASALHAAHQIGLVHRDVKPTNILLTDTDFAYLIDFGIARAAGETGLTSTGSTLGTWAYMAPERFGTGAADHRSDVYALACVLFQCLTARLPFPGDSIEQQVAGHLTMPPPQPSAVNTLVPQSFDDVIASGMAKDPVTRYATTMDLAQAARAALSGPGEAAARLGSGAPRSPARKVQESRPPSDDIPGIHVPAPLVALRGAGSGDPSQRLGAIQGPSAVASTQAGPTVSAAAAPTQHASTAGIVQSAEHGSEDSAVQEDADQGLSGNYSSRVQAVITAVLLIPTMVATYVVKDIWYAHDGPREGTYGAVLGLIVGVYFIAVVGFQTRNPNLRGWVMLTAALAVLLDVFFMLMYFAGQRNSVDRMLVVLALAILLYTVAWGIARRQHTDWWYGLALCVITVPGYLICFLGLNGLLLHVPDWLTIWGVHVGSFVVAGLTCWSLDVGGRRRARKSLH